MLLHVRPTSIRCVVDWGSIPSSIVDEADAAEDAATTATVEGGPSEELQERSRAPAFCATDLVRKFLMWRTNVST
ncbi:hypothetical protein BDA96_07G126900 [Sorghum bicolor]|uniref:Uncharacterized protein n=2 Tax=Sorghum bicolor TaxID=4558 RepID=A0A921U9K4_SORBI|nr:hypothetical protein BDA96_07G126900 [Sorghum bicolor]OQU80379.1 hypothetical protein SORBI_3007G118050 [Sorghum bicolor]